jgi:non-specific serine/threonine protein kinase
LRCRKIYRWANQQTESDLQQEIDYLGNQSNVCFFCDRKAELDILQQMLRDGWKLDKDRGLWKLNDEPLILDFIVENRHRMAAQVESLTLSPELEAILDRITTVSAHVQVSERGQGVLGATLGFRSDSGKELDPGKIRALLEAGKRLIQTSDGNQLILPRESWELFQRSMSDLQLRQEKGEYLAKNQPRILFEYLNKYVDKSFNVNDLDDIQLKEFPDLNAVMRDYQVLGASWLCDRLSNYGFALLADEMGLGKTIQTIATEINIFKTNFLFILRIVIF